MTKIVTCREFVTLSRIRHDAAQHQKGVEKLAKVSKLRHMDDIPATNSGDLIEQDHGGAILPPARPGDPPKPGAGRPRKGQTRLARAFSRQSRAALAEMGIDLPGKVRIDENAIRECCRALAPEMIGRLRWIAGQTAPSYIAAARAAAADLLRLAGAEPVAKAGPQSVTNILAGSGETTDAFLRRCLGLPDNAPLPGAEPEPAREPVTIEHDAIPDDLAEPGPDIAGTDEPTP